MEQDKLAHLVREVLNEVMVKKSNPSAQPKKNLARENIARWLGHEPLLRTEKKILTQDKFPVVSVFDTKEESQSGTEKTKDQTEKNLIPNARRPEKLEAMLKTTPARVGVWRTGTRYLTQVALKLRADHAVAKDAVYSELQNDFAQKNGWIALTTQAKDREEFLLRPDLGRKLSEESLKIVLDKGTKNPDIQITVSDGLSAWAAERNAKPMVDELVKICEQAGYKVGTVFCVKYARIAVQDVIGEMLGAKISLILLGERPGLGGGDSLSNYIAYAPKIGMVNAGKSMISNIHPNGHKPIEAAKLTFEMIRKMFDQKCSGVELKI